MTDSRADADQRPEDGIDAATLLGDDHEPFEAVLAGDSTGPLAVVGPPYSGRSRVLDTAADRLDATRIDLGPEDGFEEVQGALGDGPVVVGDCQHLYRRAIGGFEPLEAFLDAVATAEAPVVTGWNRYAWSYLDAVRAVERAIPDTVAVGPVATEAIAELVLGRYDEMPAFPIEDTNSGGLVTVRTYPVGWGDRTISVPLPVPNRNGSDPDSTDPQDVVFERLAAASDGNVGVATALWRAQSETAVRPSDIVPPEPTGDLDRDAAFCLRIIIAKERVSRAELDAVVGDGVDRILAQFRRDGVVTVDETTVALEPAAVPTAADATDRGRIL